MLEPEPDLKDFTTSSMSVAEDRLKAYAKSDDPVERWNARMMLRMLPALEGILDDIRDAEAAGEEEIFEQVVSATPCLVTNIVNTLLLSMTHNDRHVTAQIVEHLGQHLAHKWRHNRMVNAEFLRPQ